jgi:hypothetical protein
MTAIDTTPATARPILAPATVARLRFLAVRTAEFVGLVAVLGAGAVACLVVG